MQIALLFLVSLLNAAGLQAQPTPAPPDNAIIWRDPGSIETKDLFWGSGAESRQPQPPFKFREENLRGTVAKVVVEDARGAIWDVKLAAEESHPEVVANRLLWAVGYPVQEMYFVHEGTITGATDLKRAKDAIKPDGGIVAARFRLRDASVEEGGGWSFAANPFVGQKELSGLIILMALINNWDTDGTKNQEILKVTKDNAAEQWYVVQDLGASFGRFQGPKGTPIKWSLQDFQKDNLVAKVDGDMLVLNYQAFATPPTRVPLEHARWFAELIGRLSDEQIRAALKAGGANRAEEDGFAQKLEARIAELKAAVAGQTRQ